MITPDFALLFNRQLKPVVIHDIMHDIGAASTRLFAIHLLPGGKSTSYQMKGENGINKYNYPLAQYFSRIDKLCLYHKPWTNDPPF